MHRTEGDGLLVDPVGGQNVFDDEDLPTRNATQLRHEEANAYQEEIANVIIAEGLSLNAATETIQQMTQLNQAIDIKVASEASARDSADDVLQTNINANTTAIGTNVTNISGHETRLDNLELDWTQITSGFDIDCSDAATFTDVSSEIRFFITNSLRLEIFGVLDGTVDIACGSIYLNLKATAAALSGLSVIQGIANGWGFHGGTTEQIKIEADEGALPLPVGLGYVFNRLDNTTKFQVGVVQLKFHGAAKIILV